MIKLNINSEISKAETLPGSFYKSQEIFDLMKEKLFLNTWQWLGDESSLVPLTESVYPTVLLEQFLDEPIAVVKDENNSIHCLSNVCTHRGNILVTNSGKHKQLICMYHGRRFDLQGNFKSMPEFKETEDFPRPCDNLHQFSIANWHGHLFTSLKPDFGFDEISKIMDERIGFLPLSQFKRDDTKSKDYLVNCHWALYCDNYLEGFHIPFVHADLNEVLDYGNYTTETYKYVNLQIGYAKGATEVFDLPQGHIDFGKNIAAYYYWVFPNMMFNFYPWGLSVNIIKPISLNKTKVSFITFVYDESKLDEGAGSLLDKVEREDEFVVEGVHKGLRSRFYTTGRFSPTREKGVHHFHSLLAEFLNK